MRHVKTAHFINRIAPRVAIRIDRPKEWRMHIVSIETGNKRHKSTQTITDGIKFVIRNVFELSFETKPRSVITGTKRRVSGRWNRRPIIDNNNRALLIGTKQLKTFTNVLSNGDIAMHNKFCIIKYTLCLVDDSRTGIETKHLHTLEEAIKRVVAIARIIQRLQTSRDGVSHFPVADRNDMTVPVILKNNLRGISIVTGHKAMSDFLETELVRWAVIKLCLIRLITRESRDNRNDIIQNIVRKFLRLERLPILVTREESVWTGNCSITGESPFDIVREILGERLRTVDACNDTINPVHIVIPSLYLHYSRARYLTKDFAIVLIV